MNVIPKLITDNPELLLYIDGKSHTTVLGGIKLTGFDRLKVTLKIVCGGNTNRAFRHNLDLYNSVHIEQLIEKAGDALDIAAAELAGVISRIVPPKAVSAMRAAANWNLSQATVGELLLKFVYDDLGRVIEKTVPGAAVLYMVYDPLNRPVLMQDGNMRSAHQWNYMKYDMKGRVISQGIYTDNTYLTRSTMQQYVTSLNYASSYYEDRSSSASGGYYTNIIFPTANTEPLAYSYYDDYDLDNNGSPDYSYQSQSLSGEASPALYTRGMLTAIRKRTVGGGLANLWLTSVMFYDKKASLIQTLRNNQLNTAVNNSTTRVPDFTGKVLITKVVRIAGSTTTVVQDTYSYDHAGRLTAIDQSLNTAAAATHLVSYQYNELGQLVTRNLQPSPSAFPDDIVLNGPQSLSAGQTQTYTAAHSIQLQTGFKVATGATFKAQIQGSGALQTVDYRYNIRGQLVSMNNSTLVNDGVTNSDSKDAFGMELLYDQTDASLGNAAYYNGQVSAVKWMARAGTLTQRSYRYTYDDQNRLSAAIYADRLNGSGSWGNLSAYDEKAITYDQNGNITALKRNAMAGSAINEVDNLQYTYDGNQLTNVTDGAGSNYTAVGFKNLTGSAAPYIYDSNGNLIQDYKKGVAFAYNYINRTDKVTITTSTGRYISYTYEADGTMTVNSSMITGRFRRLRIMSMGLFTKIVLCLILGCRKGGCEIRAVP